MRRILILSASIGMGHLKAAQALACAFEPISSAEVRHEDALNFANAAFRNLYAKSYADLVNKAPEFLGWLYEQSDRAWEEVKHGMAFQRLNAMPLIKLVKDYSPDIVVCTHALPADMISWLICKGEIQTRQAIVVTDFDIHSAWLCNHYSRYFVALDETREHLVQLGFERTRITLSGIPVDPVFRVQKDKQAMRVKHGLATDKLTILISAGGFGMLPMERVLLSMKQVSRPFQIVAVCGHNHELVNQIETFRSQNILPEGSIHTVGYTSCMDELMAAADLIVGKPGGLTVSEALVKGLPFVVMHPIPGQEERNADHLLEEGAAIRCNNLATVGYKIDQLVSDKARLETLRLKALKLGNPSAAEQIAGELIQLSDRDEPGAIHPANHNCSPALFDHLSLYKLNSEKHSLADLFGMP